MKNLWKWVSGVSAIVMTLGLGINAHAASAVGPYYAVPSWNQKFDSNTRFIVLTNWNNEAVLDRETGLVWEKVPSLFPSTWRTALARCIHLNLGGRMGWRLPTIQDLLSLIDLTQSNPMLPSGHPFSVLSTLYWSATTDSGDADGAWHMTFSDNVVSVASLALKSRFNFVWCVRGGPGVDPQ